MKSALFVLCVVALIAGTIAAAPEVFKITPIKINANNVRVTFTGSNFGTGTPKVKLGAYDCKNVILIDTTALSCVASGKGINVAPVVTVGTEKNILSNARFDYPEPETNAVCSAPNGSPDYMDSSVCNCWSGYAPANSAAAYMNTECDTHAVCPGQALTVAVTGSFSKQPKVQFKGDVLVVRQESPIVSGRRDTHIHFESASGTGATTCSYPGPIWVKTVNTLDCNDVYTATLAWSQHGSCGFVKNNPIISDDFDHYESTLVTNVIDVIKSSRAPFIRATSYSYKLTVKFASKLVATITIGGAALSVDAPSEIDVEVISVSPYDATTSEQTLNIRTTTNWPYKIGAGFNNANGVFTSSLAVPPAPTEISVVVEDDSSATDSCPNTINTVCEQFWIVTINNDNDAPGTPACDIQGSILFNTNAPLCRNTDGVCAAAGTGITFTLTIGQTNLCASEEIDASNGVYSELQAFADAAFTTPATVFQVGDTAYFKLLVNDTSTIDSLAITDISLYNGATVKPDSTVDCPIATCTQSHVYAPSSASKGAVVVSEPTTQLDVGQTAVLTFSFKMDSTLDETIGQITPTTPLSAGIVWVQYAVNFHGNTMKRSVAGAEEAAGTVRSAGLQLFVQHNDDVYEDAGIENFDAVTEEMAEYDFFGFSAATSTSPAVYAIVVIVAVVALMF